MRSGVNLPLSTMLTLSAPISSSRRRTSTSVCVSTGRPPGILAMRTLLRWSCIFSATSTACEAGSFLGST
mgnify:CR=1 FL=1